MILRKYRGTLCSDLLISTGKDHRLFVFFYLNESLVKHVIRKCEPYILLRHGKWKLVQNKGSIEKFLPKDQFTSPPINTLFLFTKGVCDLPFERPLPLTGVIWYAAYPSTI